MEFLDGYKVKLEKLINSYPTINHMLTALEEKTKVKKVYIAFGALGAVVLWLAIGYGAQLLCNGIGFVYPAYCSVKALETRDRKDDMQWLMYWVVFALFSVVEFFSDILVGWVPFYWLSKCLFLVWCMSPMDGSTLIYHKVILPFFNQNQRSIDNALNKGRDTIAAFADDAMEKVKAMALEKNANKVE